MLKAGVLLGLGGERLFYSLCECSIFLLPKVCCLCALNTVSAARRTSLPPLPSPPHLPSLSLLSFFSLSSFLFFPSGCLSHTVCSDTQVGSQHNGNSSPATHADTDTNTHINLSAPLFSGVSFCLFSDGVPTREPLFSATQLCYTRYHSLRCQ